MGRVTVYLRTALFSFGTDESHVPPGATVVRGIVSGGETEPGGLRIRTRSFLDDRGREVSAAELDLLLPWSKVDHVQIEG